jgi:pyruvate/2-oxoglutarate/acetoin dehydrogenase E1 component
VLAPATIADARYMLAKALADPDPVLIFEHVMLYNNREPMPKAEDCADMH